MSLIDRNAHFLSLLPPPPKIITIIIIIIIIIINKEINKQNKIKPKNRSFIMTLY